MIIVIYAAEESVFLSSKEKLTDLGYSASNIIFANSKQQTRLDIIKKYTGHCLFFLDHDCMLSAEQAKALNNIYNKKINESLDSWLIAGTYCDSDNSTAMQKAHNWIANSWLYHSYENNTDFPMFLGGVFLVYSEATNFKKDLEIGVWGGEDKYLAKVLSEAGFKFELDKNLKVNHLTSKSLFHFLRRAY